MELTKPFILELNMKLNITNAMLKLKSQFHCKFQYKTLLKVENIVLLKKNKLKTRKFFECNKRKEEERGIEKEFESKTLINFTA